MNAGQPIPTLCLESKVRLLVVVDCGSQILPKKKICLTIKCHDYDRAHAGDNLANHCPYCQLRVNEQGSLTSSTLGPRALRKVVPPLHPVVRFGRQCKILAKLLSK